MRSVGLNFIGSPGALKSEIIRAEILKAIFALYYII